MRVEGAVPKVVSPTRAEFTERFVTPQKPVVISGATKHWPAYSKWTTEYLRATIGRKKVRVKESTSGIYTDLFSGTSSAYGEVEISDYIDLITSKRPDRKRKYLSGDEIKIVSDYSDVDPELAPLRNDFEPPEYCDREQIKTIGLWLSAQGVIASLHYDSDGSHNLNVQVKGKKRVLLFSPSQPVYPFTGVGPSRAPSNFSQINIVDPDEPRFPGFRAASCVEAIIEEGDMLFIPSYWHHAVFHEGDVNINVNFWWQPTDFRLNKTSYRATFLTILDSALSGGKADPDATRAKKALESLSPETQRILKQMEDLIPRQYRL